LEQSEDGFGRALDQDKAIGKGTPTDGSSTGSCGTGRPGIGRRAGEVTAA
jgi:hypothetical protein